jgi:preprotein translocase subunit SecE
MTNIGDFLSKVVIEMRKVSWPKRKELTRYTVIVLSTVIVMALYFSVIDLGISSVLRWFLAL